MAGYHACLQRLYSFMKSFVFEQLVLFRVDSLSMTLYLRVLMPQGGLEVKICVIFRFFSLLFFYGITCFLTTGTILRRNTSRGYMCLSGTFLVSNASASFGGIPA